MLRGDFMEVSLALVVETTSLGFSVLFVDVVLSSGEFSSFEIFLLSLLEDLSLQIFLIFLSFVCACVCSYSFAALLK
jgi:hypothetical protein